MKHYPLYLFFYVMLSGCNSSPKSAANDVCDCLDEVIRIADKSKMSEIIDKGTECIEKGKKYEKRFSGKQLEEFNVAAKECADDFLKKAILDSF